MGGKEKPRLAELLGVEVGERFAIKEEMGLEFEVNPFGYLMYGQHPRPDADLDCVSERAIYRVINDPSLVIRKPRFSDEEMVVLKALWKANMKNCKKYESGTIGFAYKNYQMGDCIQNMLSNILRPGERVDLEAMFGKEGGDGR